MLRYRGLLYRALNPVWAREPLSGEGARLYGGRFNAKGTPALYTSLSMMTAIREANQIGYLQPTTLVCYRADVGPIFDATDSYALSVAGMFPENLNDDGWRLRMIEEGRAPTQVLAAQLIADGFAGMLVPSFAPGTDPDDRNLVLWKWEGMLELVDDEGRLDRPD